MTELVIVSKPRMRFVKWRGGGEYTQYLATLSTSSVALSPYVTGTSNSVWRNLYSGQARVALRFQTPPSPPASNIQPIRAIVRLQRIGNLGTTPVNIKIWDDNNGVPGSEVATIGSMQGNSVSATTTDYTFTPTNPPTLNGGAYYWVGVEYSGGNSSNYLNVFSAGSGTRAYQVGTSWTVESGAFCMQIVLRCAYTTSLDFVYTGTAEKRLKAVVESQNISVTSRRVNGQTISSDPTETQQIPQADSYTIEYIIESTATSYATHSTFRFSEIRRFLHYAASSITLDQLGGSEAYITKVAITSSGGGHLRLNDDPDADIIMSGSGSVVFDAGTLPFRKAEWISGSGEVDILVVE